MLRDSRSYNHLQIVIMVQVSKWSTLAIICRIRNGRHFRYYFWPQHKQDVANICTAHSGFLYWLGFGQTKTFWRKESRLEYDTCWKKTYKNNFRPWLPKQPNWKLDLHILWNPPWTKFWRLGSGRTEMGRWITGIYLELDQGFQKQSAFEYWSVENDLSIESQTL